MGKKSGSSSPAPVDPAALARQQAEANRITQFLPTGNLVFGDTFETEGSEFLTERRQTGTERIQTGFTMGGLGSNPRPIYEDRPIFEDVQVANPNFDPNNPSGSLGFKPGVNQAALRLEESENQQAIRELRESLSTTVGTQAQLLASDLPKNLFNTNDLPALVSALQTGGLPNMASGLETGGLPTLAGGIDEASLGARGPGGIDLSQLQQFAGVGTPGGKPDSPGRDRRGKVVPAGAVVGGGTDLNAAAQAVEDATFQRQMRLFQPQFDKQRMDLEQSLANRGLPTGAELNTTEMRNLSDAQNEAMLRAGLDSVMAGRQEQSRLFDISSRERAQQFGEHATNLDLGRQLRASDIGEQITAQNIASVARGQGINEQLASSGLAQALRGQDIAEQMQSAGLNQTARQLGLQEKLTTRQLPFNELAVLLGLDQTAPTSLASFVPPGAVDVVGPASLAAQQQIAAAQQAAAGQQNMMSGLFGLGGALGSAAILGCWVAQEVYGIMNPTWLLFREWLENDAPKWFLRLYLKHGERFAAWISDKPRLKKAIRWWMDGRIRNSRAARRRMIQWRAA